MVRGSGAPSKEVVQAAARKATFTPKAWVELAEKIKSDGTLRDEVNKLDNSQANAVLLRLTKLSQSGRLTAAPAKVQRFVVEHQECT